MAPPVNGYQFETDRFGRRRILFDNPQKQEVFDALFRLGGADSSTRFDVESVRDLQHLVIAGRPRDRQHPEHPFAKLDYNTGFQAKAAMMDAMLDSLLKPDTTAHLYWVDKDRDIKPTHMIIEHGDTLGSMKVTALDHGEAQFPSYTPERPHRPSRWQRFWNTVSGGRLYKPEIETYRQAMSAYEIEMDRAALINGQRDVVSTEWPEWESAPNVKKPEPTDVEKKLAEVQFTDNFTADARKNRERLYGLERSAPESTPRAMQSLFEEAKVPDAGDFRMPNDMTKDDYTLLCHMSIMSKKNAALLATDQVTNPAAKQTYMATHSTEDVNGYRDGLTNIGAEALRGAHLDTREAITQDMQGNPKRLGQIVAETLPIMVHNALRNEGAMTAKVTAQLEECSHLHTFLNAHPNILQAAKQAGLQQKDIEALNASNNLYHIRQNGMDARVELMKNGQYLAEGQKRALANTIATEALASALVKQHYTDVMETTKAREDELVRMLDDKNAPANETYEGKVARVRAVTQEMQDLGVMATANAPSNDRGIALLNDPAAMQAAVDKMPVMQRVNNAVARGADIVEEMAKIDYLSGSGAKGLAGESDLPAPAKENNDPLAVPMRHIEEVKLSPEQRMSMGAQMKRPQLDMGGMGKG